LFYGSFFICNNLGDKVVDFRAYGRNSQAGNAFVTPYNIGFYKCHSYGHIARDFRIMMDTSKKVNIDIRYKKIWKRKQEQVKEEHSELILLVFSIVQDHDRSTGKNIDVRYKKVWRRNEKQEE
jgi:hypothetical protein